MEAKTSVTTRRLGALAVLVVLFVASLSFFVDISFFVLANDIALGDAVALLVNATTTTPTAQPTSSPSTADRPHSRTVNLRRSIVYVYDWFGYCHARGLCEAPTVIASRKAACKSTDQEVSKYHCEIDPYGSLAPNLQQARAPGFQVRNTDQFATTSVYDTRLLNSAWRTRDPSKAELFYIPLEPLAERVLGQSAYSRMKRTWMHTEVLPSRWFTRNGGRDHFLVFSLCKQYISTVSPFVDRELSAVTKLTIENYGARAWNHRAELTCRPGKSTSANWTVWAARSTRPLQQIEFPCTAPPFIRPSCTRRQNLTRHAMRARIGSAKTCMWSCRFHCKRLISTPTLCADACTLAACITRTFARFCLWTTLGPLT